MPTPHDGERLTPPSSREAAPVRCQTRMQSGWRTWRGSRSASAAEPTAAGALEAPGQERVEAAVGMADGETFEGGLQVGEGLDAVYLASGDERGDAGPVGSALVVIGKEAVLAREGHGSDQIFDSVRVQLVLGGDEWRREQPQGRAEPDAGFAHRGDSRSRSAHPVVAGTVGVKSLRASLGGVLEEGGVVTAGGVRHEPPVRPPAAARSRPPCGGNAGRGSPPPAPGPARSGSRPTVPSSPRRGGVRRLVEGEAPPATWRARWRGSPAAFRRRRACG